MESHKCWNDFCIADFCDGVNHLGFTGDWWAEKKPAACDDSSVEPSSDTPA
jgi:hypothetical protein